MNVYRERFVLTIYYFLVLYLESIKDKVDYIWGERRGVGRTSIVWKIAELPTSTMLRENLIY